MSNENLIYRLRKRAEIRRSIPRGEPDRISDLLEEAANYIESLETCVTLLVGDIRELD
jgi:hypothetical protein